MILLRLFLVFSYIGLFNFGGGYAMLSFIQQEIVEKRGWVSDSEFTDIVAISQTTPGPIGINCATYVGYTAVVNDPEIQSLSAPYAIHICGIIGSVLASVSVLWLPFIVMILVSKLILRYKESTVLKSIFGGLRPAIIGLLATASLSLLNVANFGSPSADTKHFIVSIAIAIVVFIGTYLKKFNILYTTIICGVIGILIYG
ncbi:MAG: chromate transporter [Bacteroidales bacterium]|nr:chromate transporter [Candidatus Liminaster caballi]